jgi:hypothetical protein
MTFDCGAGHPPDVLYVGGQEQIVPGALLRARRHHRRFPWCE